MSEGGYAVEVTGLSPAATIQDVTEFFSFCGAIENLEVVRSGDVACAAYVTFKDAYSQETAVLLSGATILDQRVCITRWGEHVDGFNFWNMNSGNWNDHESVPRDHDQYSTNAGEAVAMAQDVVKAMLSRGYILGKDALGKAKAFDESHQVSATAAAKVAELTERIGLADMLFSGMEAAKAVDEKFHVSQTTKSAIFATGRGAAAAANTVVSSSYFSKGALWVSGALDRASKLAADLGNKNARN